VREEERLQDGIHTYPEKSSVCGLFLAFFKLPTRDKIFSSKFHTTFPNLLQQQKQEKKKPTTKNKTKQKKISQNTQTQFNHCSPSLSFVFTSTTTQLQNPKPDLDAS
jgi:hypothetical protein